MRRKNRLPTYPCHSAKTKSPNSRRSRKNLYRAHKRLKARKSSLSNKRTNWKSKQRNLALKKALASYRQQEAFSSKLTRQSWAVGASTSKRQRCSKRWTPSTSDSSICRVRQNTRTSWPNMACPRPLNGCSVSNRSKWCKNSKVKPSADTKAHKAMMQRILSRKKRQKRCLWAHENRQRNNLLSLRKNRRSSKS